MAKVPVDIDIQPDTELSARDFRILLNRAVKKKDGTLLGKLISNVSCPAETWKKYIWLRPEAILHPLAYVFMDIGLEESDRNLLQLASRWCPDASPIADLGEDILLVAADSYMEYSVGNDRLWQGFIALIPEEERRSNPELLHDQEGEAWPSQVLDLFHEKLADPSLLDEDVATLWEDDGHVPPGVKKSILSRPGLVVDLARWYNVEFYGQFFDECFRQLRDQNPIDDTTNVGHMGWIRSRDIEIALMALIFPGTSNESVTWSLGKIMMWPVEGVFRREDFPDTVLTRDFFGKKNLAEPVVFGHRGENFMDDMVGFAKNLSPEVRANFLQYSYEYDEDMFERTMYQMFRDWFGMENVVKQFSQEVSDGKRRDYAYEAWQQIRPGAEPPLNREIRRLGLIYFSKKHGIDLVQIAKEHDFNISVSVFSFSR